jgi:hypothetical protein
MPDTSNKALNADHGSDAPPTIAPHGMADQGQEAPRGHAAENAQTFSPTMTAPGAGSPDGPDDDGSPGGPTSSTLDPDGHTHDAPAPTDEQIEDAALGGRVGR